MSEDPDPTETLIAARDGIRVEKRFNPDEFAVPTIQFTIVSEREDRVDVTLTDQIPAEFPMDGVGFHPDYEGGHWSYGEGCVTFERTIEDGESVTTVYGIRISEPSEVVPFLAEPELAEISPVADGSGPSEPREIDADGDEQTIDDIVPESSTGVVRELLTDESASVPGLEETGETVAADAPTAVDAADTPAESGTETSDESVADDPLAADPLADDPVAVDPLADEPIGEDSLADEPAGEDHLSEPLDLDDPVEPSDADSKATSDSSTPESAADIELDLDGADVGADDEAVAAVEDDGPSSVDESTIPVIETTSPAGTGESSDAVTADGQGSNGGSGTERGATPSEAIDTTGGESVDDLGTAVSEGGITAALADELRSDSVDEADLDVLRTALRLERSESERVRMSHLQSRVSDLEAYIDALEAFIDEHGTVDRLLEELRSESASISEQVSDLETLVTANTEEVTALDTEVSAIDERVADVSNEVADVSDEVADVDDDVEHVRETIATLEADISAVATDVESISTTFDSFDEELTGVRAAVEDIEDEFEDRVSAAREDVESDVDALEERLETVRDDIDELVDWRDQLGEMFSGSR